MRWLYAIGVAAVVATALVSAQQKNSTCATTLSIAADGSIDEPAKMTCKVGEQMVISIANKHSAHRVQIADIRCADGSGLGNNPTKNFVRKPKELGNNETQPFEFGWGPFKSKPEILGNSDAKKMRCGPDGMPNYKYKYTIRISDPNGESHATDRDPDLEIDPPPA